MRRDVAHVVKVEDMVVDEPFNDVEEPPPTVVRTSVAALNQPSHAMFWIV